MWARDNPPGGTAVAVLTIDAGAAGVVSTMGRGPVVGAGVCAVGDDAGAFVGNAGEACVSFRVDPSSAGAWVAAANVPECVSLVATAASTRSSARTVSVAATAGSVCKGAATDCSSSASGPASVSLKFSLQTHTLGPVPVSQTGMAISGGDSRVEVAL